ncbi:hypothetical protein AA313_de0205470 [Arthrobotrys entomopaga]|nr:hypothetical protein AA313_de0205470 [Arthrobotrys entomopaga]
MGSTLTNLSNITLFGGSVPFLPSRPSYDYSTGSNTTFATDALSTILQFPQEQYHPPHQTNPVFHLLYCCHCFDAACKAHSLLGKPHFAVFSSSVSRQIRSNQ